VPLARTGVLIALAWPDTYCKGTGAWYDGLAEKLRISKNNNNRVGHAALVLVDGDSGAAEYFDFGRYHCPSGFGRVRSASSDHNLGLSFRAQIKADGHLANLSELLSELNTMSQCHGDGPLIAAQSLVNYKMSRAYIAGQEEQELIPYGPFVRGGTNCARFVLNTLDRGFAPFNWRLKLAKYPSPLPLFIVKSMGSTCLIPKSTFPNYEDFWSKKAASQKQSILN
jgi:hypothetical protein